MLPIEESLYDKNYYYASSDAKRIIEVYEWGVVLHFADFRKRHYATVIVRGSFAPDTGKIVENGVEEQFPEPVRSWYKDLLPSIPSGARASEPAPDMWWIPECIGRHEPCLTCDGGMRLPTQEIERACAARSRCLAVQAYCDDKGTTIERALGGMSKAQIEAATRQWRQQYGPFPAPSPVAPVVESVPQETVIEGMDDPIPLPGSVERTRLIDLGDDPTEPEDDEAEPHEPPRGPPPFFEWPIFLHRPSPRYAKERVDILEGIEAYADRFVELVCIRLRARLIRRRADASLGDVVKRYPKKLDRVLVYRFYWSRQRGPVWGRLCSLRPCVDRGYLRLECNIPADVPSLGKYKYYLHPTHPKTRLEGLGLYLPLDDVASWFVEEGRGWIKAMAK